jgi:hypothetical protein
MNYETKRKIGAFEDIALNILSLPFALPAALLTFLDECQDIHKKEENKKREIREV